MQWHPLFAELLRGIVEAYYDVQTNVPVGDIPREADIVLLRRKPEAAAAPFRNLWSGLTTWNVLEFKSPTVTPMARDIDLLVELGLGIDRRLNWERTKQGHSPLEPHETSLWYLANRLGKRFLRQAQERLGMLEPAGEGIWRGRILLRDVDLVSNSDLAVNEESVPLHLVSREPHDKLLSVAQFVLDHRALRQRYAEWVLVLHESAWKEARTMSRVEEDEVPINYKRIAEYIGVERLISVVGVKRVIEDLGVQRVIAEVGLDRLIASLTPAQRRELKRKLR
ncbi:MAG: hypothetical protein HY000_42005 [Planctomycetes bacterium]|nr:hypothetical protein [Planctomycetota bacterium]